MIRIKLANGTVVEMDGGEEISAPIISALLGSQVTIPVDIPIDTAPTLPVAPEIVGDEIDDEAEEDGDDEMMLSFHKHDVSDNHKRRVRHIPQNPPTPPGRWPDIFYITPECWEVVELLREHPVGLTSNQIEEMLKLNRTVGSGRLNTLMTVTPLIEKMGIIYRLSIIGRDKTLKLDLSKLRPSPINKGLGWDRFMAEPLPDGRHAHKRKNRSA